MSIRYTPIAAALTFAALAQAPALAASANTFTRQGQQTVHAPGSAKVEFRSASQLAAAEAAEYRGGVGVLVKAESNSGLDGGDHIPQASAEAWWTDTITVGLGGDQPELGTGLYAVTFSIGVSGKALVNQFAAPNGVPMSAVARYEWSFGIGGFGAAGSIDRRLETVFENGLFSARETVVETGFGSKGVFSDVIFVRKDAILGFVARASAFAAGPSYGLGGSSATADFSHTLRWLGVSHIQYQDLDGSFIDAPDDYRLTLMSQDGQFDYFNAAGRNPFAAAVPEPSAWALLILGFGMVGAGLRRRRTALALGL